MSHVFISYAEEDRALAQALSDGLEATGFTTWYYERDNFPGVDYLTQTGQAIEECDALLLLVSPNSLRSDQIHKEVVRAHESSKAFIPVLSEVTHAEFQARRPAWRQAIGGATSVPVPPDGVRAILPRIVRGLQMLRIEPASTAVVGRTTPSAPATALPPVPAPPVPATPVGDHSISSPAAREGTAPEGSPLPVIPWWRSGRYVGLVAAAVLVLIVFATFLLRQIGPGGGAPTAPGVSTQTTPTPPLADEPPVPRPEPAQPRSATKPEPPPAPAAPATPPPAAAARTTRDDGAGLVLVPAGQFWMGSDENDNEKPRHRVTLDGFNIDKYEVTNALYQKFMSATGHPAPLFWDDSRFNGPQQPVLGVSRDDADAYCRWAGKRLPTEAEWEKAARGTDGRKYPWGDQWDASRANSDESRLGKTVEVGSYPTGASPYGAQDMAGNVWEWVADRYAEDYYKRSPDWNPSGAGCRRNQSRPAGRVLGRPPARPAYDVPLQRPAGRPEQLPRVPLREGAFSLSY